MKKLMGACLVVAATAGFLFETATRSNATAQQTTGPATVYTANNDGASVSVLDGTTLVQAHADIATSGGPNAVAVSPDGLRVYSATNSGDIAVIDATTNEFIQNIPLGVTDAVTDLVVSPNSLKVYATLRLSAAVVVINTTTLQKVDTFNLQTISSNSPQPEAIDVSGTGDGDALFVLTPADFRFQKISAVNGSLIDSAAVSAAAKELKVSADGSTVIVVGDNAAQFYSSSTLVPVVGASPTDRGTQLDLAVAGANVYVLNSASTQAPPVTAKSGPKGFTVQPSIDVYTAGTGAFVKSFFLGAASNVLGIAVLSDGSKAYVSREGGENPGTVTAVDLTTGAQGPTGNAGGFPRRLAVKENGPETPVVSYFLPRNINLKLKGAGKDSLIAAGFYDDGGPRPDYTQPVTIDVGTFFTRTFTLVPKGKSFAAPKDPVVKFFILPNLRGSSRGRFKMQLNKATLTGANPDLPVEFHFHATGMPDCQGKITLTAGRYTFGKKRGALILPQFFPQRANAKVGAANADSLLFVGGFATNGQTPNALTGAFRFGFGPAFLRVVAGTQFKKTGDKFKYSLKQGKSTVLSITLDFLRESVTVAAKKVELGNLDTGVIDVRFDAGTGAGTFRNTIRIATKGSKRFY